MSKKDAKELLPVRPDEKTDPEGHANTELWFALPTTPLKHTQEVGEGKRTFTAIEAIWQIYQMTRLFGPIGQGWGYKTAFQVVPADPNKERAFVLAEVTLWYMRDGNVCTYGPMGEMSELYVRRTDWQAKKAGDPDPYHWVSDADAAKKATTGALTKLFSQLGLSHDVFFGAFDDNRYVADREQEDKVATKKISAAEKKAVDADDAAYKALREPLTKTVDQVKVLDLELCDGKSLDIAAVNLGKAWQAFARGYQEKLSAAGAERHRDHFFELKKMVAELGEKVRAEIARQAPDAGLEESGGQNTSDEAPPEAAE